MGLPRREPEPRRDEPERRVVALRPVLEFDAERLKRLQERMRDTRDP
jgi:hypothetical protein